jgi:hypothetical protein
MKQERKAIGAWIENVENLGQWESCDEVIRIAYDAAELINAEGKAPYGNAASSFMIFIMLKKCVY